MCMCVELFAGPLRPGSGGTWFHRANMIPPGRGPRPCFVPSSQVTLAPNMAPATGLLQEEHDLPVAPPKCLLLEGSNPNAVLVEWETNRTQHRAQIREEADRFFFLAGTLKVSMSVGHLATEKRMETPESVRARVMLEFSQGGSLGCYFSSTAKRYMGICQNMGTIKWVVFSFGVDLNQGLIRLPTRENQTPTVSQIRGSHRPSRCHV